MRTGLLFALLLLALGVAAPAAGAQEARTATVVLGEANDEQGLDQFDEADGRTAPVQARPAGRLLALPFAVRRYALTAANDSPERDPRDWTLSGSNDRQTWTELDRQAGQDFDERFDTKEYAFENAAPYRYYRLDITANHAEGIIQLAELRLFTDE